jgi:mannitol 2-dehydrogenase
MIVDVSMRCRYGIDDTTGEFIETAPEVQEDIAAGASPKTAFGLITEALTRRRANNTLPFAIMSCDNIPGNGDVAKKAICAFASLRDNELGHWVAENVAFPSSMVTPPVKSCCQNMHCCKQHHELCTV